MAHICQNHLERNAIGICVKCRKYICVECATKIAGVNYCADCLPRVSPKKKRDRQLWEKPLVVIVVIFGLALCSLFIGTCFALVPYVGAANAQEQKYENRQWLETIVYALEGFRSDCGRFPRDSEGLKVLLRGGAGVGEAAGIENWQGSYIDMPMLNQWNEFVDVYDNPLEYRSQGLAAPVIISAGYDGSFQSDVLSIDYGEQGEGDDEIIWVK